MFKSLALAIAGTTISTLGLAGSAIAASLYSAQTISLSYPSYHSFSYSSSPFANYFDINNQGQVAYTLYGYYGQPGSGNTHVFFWDNKTGMRYVGPGMLGGINDEGLVAYTSTIPNTLDQEAIIWDSKTQTNLYRVPGAIADINDNNQVLYSYTANGTTRNSIWNLDNSSFISAPTGIATDLNNQGQVLLNGTSPGSYLWNSSTNTQQYLGTAPATDLSDRGEVVFYPTYATNNLGQSVGTSAPYGFSTSSNALLWENGTATSLSTSSLSLFAATAINDRGQIVALGYNTQSSNYGLPSPGFLHNVYLLTPIVDPPPEPPSEPPATSPEPSAVLALVTMGLLGMKALRPMSR
jgi:hypothetical protein